MKKMSKLSTIILSCVILIIIIGGCVNDKGIKNSIGEITKEELDPAKIGYYSTLKLPIDKNGTRISIICDTSVNTNNESVVVKELRRRTGIDIEIIAIPRATIKEKSKVLLASKNEIPDLFGGLSRDELNDLGMQGAFEPIEQNLDKLPNFKEIFFDKAEEYGTVDKLKNFKALDGNLYIFPSYDISRTVNHGMLYRKDIFDKHGIPMWNNKEEFYQALKQLKKIYPNSNPMVSKTNTGIFTDIGYSWGLDGYNKYYYDEDTKLWKFTYTDLKYKEMLDFLKKLYDEGLLDPEFLTDTQASWTAKMTQPDKAFVTWDWIGRLDMFYEQAIDAVPGYDLRYANPIGGKVVTLSKVGSGKVIKKSDKSILAMKLCDYLISPSGAQLMTLGIEGITYEIGEDGFAKYYGFEEGQAVGIDALEEKYGLFISGLYKRFDRRSAYFNYSEKEAEAQKLMLDKPDGFMPEDPDLTFTKEEEGTRTQYITDLSKAAEEFSVKYILSSETGEAAWNSWLKKAELLGAQKVTEVYNQAQKRYNEN